MDNSTAIRRKAQKLIQKGDYEEAVSVYAKLAESSHLEPHDLVVYADLLSRNGKRSEAVGRYLEAMDSYSQAGLFRNAIALGKKLQRLSPDTSLTHRKLGDLYASEGLASEACLHYLEFLQSTPGRDGEAGDAILEVGGRLLELSLPSFDVVDRIVDAAKAVGRGKELAGGVLSQAERAASLGNADAEGHLVEIARALDPEAATAAANGSGGDRMILEPGTVELPAGPGTAEVAAEEVPEAPAVEEPQTPSVLSLDGFSFQQDDDAAQAEAEPEPEDAAAGRAAPVVNLPAEPEPEPVGEPELEAPEAGDAFLAGTPEPPRDGANLVGEADTLRARAMNFLGTNDPVRAQMEFMKAAGLYFEAARSRDAAELYERVVSMDPNHLDALRGLVEIAHINGEKAKMAHWGCELGDVLLAREKYPEAKVQFERVLAFDPKNAKAQARVKRLNTMAGVKEAGYGELAPAASEVQGAQVTIRDDEAGRGKQEQSALNLSQILDEFRAAVVDSIPAGDARSHFDLGMTYMEMGLHAEAALEFETSSGDQDNRLASLEMLGECYRQLEQFEDALRVYEQLVDEADGTVKARACCHLGEAAEALGEWDRAEAEYTRALDLDENYEEALERLQILEQRREQGAA